MRITHRTRYPWVFILLGVVFLCSAGSWLSEFERTGQITMSRAGIPVTTYGGSLAILVIVADAIFACYLLFIGVMSWVKKGQDGGAS